MTDHEKLTEGRHADMGWTPEDYELEAAHYDRRWQRRVEFIALTLGIVGIGLMIALGASWAIGRGIS